MNKIKWIFIIGIEGSGHHAIMDLLRDSFSEDKDIDRILCRRWSTGKMFGPWSKVFRLEKRLAASHFIYSSSFPFNNPRDSTRRPNIADMVENLGDRLYPIVLSRNPSDCVMSAVRRGFTRSVQLQATISADNQRYINASLYRLPRMHRIAYEELVADPETECLELANYLGHPEIALRHHRIRKPLFHKPNAREREIMRTILIDL